MVEQNDIQEILNKLKLGYICDLKKPEIDKFERAKLIQNYLDEHKMSQHKFAEEFGFKQSTVNDWLMYNNISKEQAEKLGDKGYSPTRIYRLLRENKNVPVDAKSTDEDSYLDTTLMGIYKVLNGHVRSAKFTIKTPTLIKQIRDTLNRIEMYAEKRNK